MTTGPFDFEIDLHGANVIAWKEKLHPGCLTDEEVDFNIKALKDDLDLVATKMKIAIRKQRETPLFEAKHG